MATHSSVLAWRIPGMGEPNWLPSMGSHRVGHDWSDLAAAAAGPTNVESCWLSKLAAQEVAIKQRVLDTWTSFSRKKLETWFYRWSKLGRGGWENFHKPFQASERMQSAPTGRQGRSLLLRKLLWKYANSFQGETGSFEGLPIPSALSWVRGTVLGSARAPV